MKNDTNLKSLLIHCCGKTYYFDIKKSEHGSKYVVIRENKIIENDQNQLIIGKDNLRSFVKALTQILPDMELEDAALMTA